MNEKALLNAQKKFLKNYPGGFNHPEMLEIGKKHKMSKMITMTKEKLSESDFKNVNEVLNSIVKMITASSMISLFEKPKFRDLVQKTMTPDEKKALVTGFYNLLHGNQKKGFEQLLLVLSPHKMAKWTIITILPNYLKPKKEVFVKPTTTKNVIKALDLPLTYHPTPSWDFYKKYRRSINSMKRKVDKSLSPSNAAFTGFLMMTYQ